MSLDVIETRMVGNLEIDVWNSKCFIAVILKESPNIMVVGTGPNLTVDQAIDKALDCLLNGEFRPVDDCLKPLNVQASPYKAIDALKQKGDKNHE